MQFFHINIHLLLGLIQYFGLKNDYLRGFKSVLFAIEKATEQFVEKRKNTHFFVDNRDRRCYTENAFGIIKDTGNKFGNNE